MKCDAVAPTRLRSRPALISLPPLSPPPSLPPYPPPPPAISTVLSLAKTAFASLTIDGVAPLQLAALPLLAAAFAEYPAHRWVESTIP